MGHAMFQSWLFGFAAGNAIWHPSWITVGLLPLFAALTVFGARKAPLQKNQQR